MKNEMTTPKIFRPVARITPDFAAIESPAAYRDPIFQTNCEVCEAPLFKQTARDFFALCPKCQGIQNLLTESDYEEFLSERSEEAKDLEETRLNHISDEQDYRSWRAS